MPKLGRRDGGRGANHESQLDYLFPQDAPEGGRLAPFGTDNTPAMRVRLVGGVPQMIVEDHKYRKEIPPTPVRLAPKVQSNRTFNPDKINTYPMSLYGYNDQAQNGMAPSNGHQSRADYARELNPDPRRSREQFSPHRVLPPVGGGGGGPRAGGNYDHDIFKSDPTSQLEQKLPLTTYLPRQPITFRRPELLELKKRVCDEMRDFDLHKLKDIYMTLTGFDRHLLGYVSFEELNESCKKYRTDITTNTLRLIASQYINDDQPPRVNYEKVLSFISGALKEANAVNPNLHNPVRPGGGGGGQYPQMLDKNVNVSSPQDGIYYNPLTHKVEDFSSTSERYPGGVKGNSKLLSLVEQQLLDDDQDLDLQLAWRTFAQADRQRRNVLSRDQIKALSRACKLPLQDAIMNQIIDRCDGSNGQYNWQQYLEFIERVAPLKTGLRIPESKKPLSYVKQIPQPSNNWPNVANPNEGSDSYGGPVPSSIQQSSQYYDPRPSQKTNDDYGKYASPRGQAPDRYDTRESRQSHHDHVHDLEKKIRDLEMQYDRDKERLYGAKNQAIVEEESWFDRFYRLANALYAQDVDSSGYVKTSEARWLINQYNLEHRLGISEPDIERTLSSCAHGDNVVLNALLSSLKMYEV